MRKQRPIKFVQDVNHTLERVFSKVFAEPQDSLGDSLVKSLRVFDSWVGQPRPRRRRRRRRDVVAEREGLMTARQAAAYLGISRRSLYRWSSLQLPEPPQIASIRVGGSRRWRRADLDDYIKRQIERQVPEYLIH
jgi:predicted DNA-binding transcriptional regulator AlpA